MTHIIRNGLIALLFTIASLSLHPDKAHAALLDELNTLTAQSQTLDTQLKAITLTANTVCGPLGAANQSARDLVNSIAAVNQNLAAPAPLHLDADILTALDQLIAINLSLANESLRLSLDLQALSATTQAFTIKDGIVAMLQLSDDIGAMADRIGEMADKILVMADNIGLMADRILITQELQSQNLQQTQQAMLQTQTNVLTLVSLAETSTNDLSLDKLILEGNLLAARMTAIILNPFTLRSQLASVATDVRAFLAKVTSANSTLTQQAATNTMYISTSTLASLNGLTIMLTGLTTAVDGYVVAINGFKAITSSTNLSFSLKSMLQLSADIGVMSNRILEMGDVILAMADNIGMAGDQILLAQQTQNANMAIVRASILGAQDMAIVTIAARNL